MFLDVLSRVGIRSVNRVCFYKYTQNLHIRQIFLWFFLKTELTQKKFDTAPKNYQTFRD